jgi:hypothetical protein
MTRPHREASSEDELYASTFAALRRAAPTIALLGPIILVSLLPDAQGGLAVLLVVIIYLFEAIAYAGLQRRRGVRPADPATALFSVSRWVRRLLVIGAIAIGLVVLGRVGASLGS